jgi:hypothetical protein
VITSSKGTIFLCECLNCKMKVPIDSQTMRATNQYPA